MFNKCTCVYLYVCTISVCACYYCVACVRGICTYVLHTLMSIHCDSTICSYCLSLSSHQEWSPCSTRRVATVPPSQTCWEGSRVWPTAMSSSTWALSSRGPTNCCSSMLLCKPRSLTTLLPWQPFSRAVHPSTLKAHYQSSLLPASGCVCWLLFTFHGRCDVPT